MRKKKRTTVELRFYEPPQSDPVLALLGESWIRVYGQDVTNLHFHNLLEIGYCRDGNGVLHFDGQQVSYQTGSVSVIPANYPHSTLSAEEKENYWEYLYFDPDTVLGQIYPNNPAYQRSLLDVINQRAIRLEEADYPAFAGTVKLIMEEMRHKSPYYKESVQGLLHSLCVSILRLHQKEIDQKMSEQKESTREKDSIPIKPALKYIVEHYAEPLRAEDIARACNMSETHLRRLFEEYVKMSPMDYLNFVRIQNACELLRKTNDSMDLVASKVGFTTTSTFNRNFKRFLDSSPYQWKINPGNYEHKLHEFNITALKGW